MGWQFGSADRKNWLPFLELCQWENLEELVFSLESVYHPDWEWFCRQAVRKGFKISLWLCGQPRHSGVDVEDLRRRIRDFDGVYPLVSDFRELYELRRKGLLGEGTLCIVFHEAKKSLSLKLFELEIRQDLFPVWAVFPEWDEARRVGMKAESLHKLFFRCQGRKWGQAFSPLPGLEMLGVRNEQSEDLIPSEIQMVVGERAPEVSFVLPAFGQVEDLRLVLEQFTRLPGPEFEVVLVDEGNRQPLKSLFDEMIAQGLQGTYLRLDHSPDGGQKPFRAGRARNLGAQYARGEILSFLDSDILLSADYLYEVREGLERFDLVQAVRLDLSTEKRRYSLQPEDLLPLSPYWQKFHEIARYGWNSIKHPWKYVCTHTLSLRKSLFVEMGGFSSLYFSYGYEDTDFGFRCFQKGKSFGLIKTPVCQLGKTSEFVSHQNSHWNRFRELKRSGSLFMRNHWDTEVFTHCHYLFDQKRSRWSHVQMLSKDLLRTLRKTSYS